MHGNKTSLAHLKPNRKAKIISIGGGRCFQRKLCTMGIREGQIIQVVSRQPLMGPLTIAFGNCKITIGRGMAHRITVEEL